MNLSFERHSSIKRRSLSHIFILANALIRLQKARTSTTEKKKMVRPYIMMKENMKILAVEKFVRRSALNIVLVYLADVTCYRK